MQLISEETAAYQGHSELVEEQVAASASELEISVKRSAGVLVIALTACFPCRPAPTLGQRIMGLEEVVNAWFHGVRAMLMAMIILILAWSLGEVTDVLKTADFLVSVLGDALPTFVLPAMVFVLAAATAFATGSGPASFTASLA